MSGDKGKRIKVPERGPVSEKSKKAGGHQTRLGPVTRVRASSFSRSCPYDRSNPGPFVTFIFRYRPAVVLQATGIMAGRATPPRDKAGPSSFTNEVEFVVDDDDDDEDTKRILALEVELAQAREKKNKNKKRLLKLELEDLNQLS